VKPYAPGGDRPIRVVCHRGANAFVPENTLEAARMCFDQRFDVVELDVRTTADGELVVIHDATVDRTTDGMGAVSDMTLAELRGLDAGGRFDRHFAGLQVPTLDEYLELAKGRGGLYVEIKDADPAAVVDAIEAKGMLDACFFWSFDVETVRKLRALSPAVKLMAVRSNYPTLAAARDDYQASVIQFHSGIDDLAEIETCRRLHVLSMILEKSDDAGALARVVELSPDYVNVDRPDLFKRVASGRPVLRRAPLQAEGAAVGG
jgi:glycerophosphoryl diester phosphodiesterase